VNALRPHSEDGQAATVRSDYTEDDITLDPLIVLRCDSRVFRFVTRNISVRKTDVGVRRSRLLARTFSEALDNCSADKKESYLLSLMYITVMPCHMHTYVNSIYR